MDKTFKFDMAQEVTLAASAEKGKVIGRAEYDHSENSYFLRYIDTMGRQCEGWFSESAIAG